jgi:hypothetical protein
MTDKYRRPKLVCVAIFLVSLMFLFFTPRFQIRGSLLSLSSANRCKYNSAVIKCNRFVAYLPQFRT